MAGYPENKRKKKPHLIPSLQRSVLPFAQVRFLFFWFCVTYFNMALFQLSPVTDRPTIDSATPQIHNHTHIHSESSAPGSYGNKGPTIYLNRSFSRTQMFLPQPRNYWQCCHYGAGHWGDGVTINGVICEILLPSVEFMKWTSPEHLVKW